MKALVLLLVLGFVNVSFAQIASMGGSQKAYYGADFYSKVLGYSKDKELKATLKDILSVGHVAIDGSFDKLVSDSECGLTKNCYKHTSYGYDRVRKIFFGLYYLVQLEPNNYGIREMYCDRIYKNEDFTKGTKPGPGVVPESSIINIEHTWPQSKFTGRYPKDLQKSDMHHLFPTDAVMNSLRGNTFFGEVSKDKGTTKCAASRFGTGTMGTTLIYEPPTDHKGHVARALFYFATRYEMVIRPEEEVVLKKWHHEHPVDEDEMKRNDFIAQIQGDRNPFIDHPELVDQIADF